MKEPKASNFFSVLIGPAVAMVRELPLKKKDRGPVSWYFIATLLIILAYGLVVLFSASYSNDYRSGGDILAQIKEQLGFAAAGLVLIFAIAQTDYRALRNVQWYLYVATLILLVIALIQDNPTNLQAKCHRWVSFLGVTFQPSELGKFSIILNTSIYLNDHKDKLGNPIESILKPLLLMMPIVLLILPQTHWSAIILIMMIFFTILLCAGCALKFLGVSIALGAGLMALVLATQEGYVQKRLDGWVPFSYDVSTMNDQTKQSVYAIASGGLFGRGIGNSVQKHQYLAEVNNDFIFPVLCEELGFIGAVVCIVLFAALILQGIYIAMNSPDMLGSLLGVGIMGQIAWQVFCNIAVVTNTIPNTGISLPFFSSGGTSLLVLMAEMGVMVSISRVGNARILEERRRRHEAFAHELDGAAVRRTHRRGGRAHTV